MAQYVFDANKYPNGTLLSQLGWITGYVPAVDYEVSAIGATGRKYWKLKTGNAFSILSFGSDVSDYEVLFLANCTKTEISASTFGFDLSFGCLAGQTKQGGAARITAKLGWDFTLTNPNSFTTLNDLGTNPNGATFTTNVAVSAFNQNHAIALRHQYISSGATIRTRFWHSAVDGLQAAEPSSWNIEGALITPRLSAPVTVDSFTGNFGFSTISIGTGGDSAPYPDPNQTVTTPTGLAVSNITATTADADWT